MHEEHRERMRRRFLREGLDHFEPHNMLELLLFYAIPRRDTNELAHLLIERFGSLDGVFDASAEELMTVPGIGENAASLIKLVPALFRQYAIAQGKPAQNLPDTDAIGKFFVKLYVGVPKETIYLLLLNNKRDIIECVKIYEGSVNSAMLTARKLVEVALFRHASMAVLAHNHPNGVPIPSRDDLYTTSDISRAFELVGVSLIAHILVADGRYTDILTH